MLAKIKRSDTLNVGYAETPAWFYKDPKTGELRGVYKELVDMLAKDLEMKVTWWKYLRERHRRPPQGGLRVLFGSSLVYTVPRGVGVLLHWPPLVEGEPPDRTQR